MVFSCFAVYLRIIIHGLYHILLVVYSPPGGHTRLKIWYNPCMIIRRYTAKQLKTIYYSHSLIIIFLNLFIYFYIYLSVRWTDFYYNNLQATGPQKLTIYIHKLSTDHRGLSYRKCNIQNLARFTEYLQVDKRLYNLIRDGFCQKYDGRRFVLGEIYAGQTRQK